MASITIYRGGRRIDWVRLGDGRVTIGRNSVSRVHLADSRVSWDHAVVEQVDDGNYQFRDRDSTNGCKLNGAAIDHALLTDGDELSIGEYRLTFNSEGGLPRDYAGSEQTMAVHAAQVQALRSAKRSPAAGEWQSPATWLGWLYALMPILAWSRSYLHVDLKHDIQAGLTVAALLIPQGMAYALVADLPPIHGLYASTLPMLVYAILGTSRQLSVAPVALDSLMVAAGIGVLASGGTELFIHLAIALALMVGVLQLLMGILRMGFVINFLSQPVLTGFTAAAAMIILASQLRHLLGLPMNATQGFFEAMSAVFQHLSQLHLLTAAIGIGGVLFLVLIKRSNIPLPGPVVLIAVSALLGWLFEFEGAGVEVVGSVPSGLPALRFELPEIGEFAALLPLALTLAAVGFMEAISVGKSFASRYGYRIDANAELRALGVSNIAAHVVGGYPVTGGFSRSAVNAGAGARTQLASIITALLITLSLVLLTPLFHHIPIAALAAVIMTAAIGLVDIAEMRYLVRVKKPEGLVLLVTLIATLLLGITTGLLAGIGSALLLFIIIQTRPNAALLGRLPGTQVFRSIERHPEAEIDSGLAILRIDASFYFANAEFLHDKVAQILAEERGLHTILLDASAINDLDSSGDRAFREIYRELSQEGIALYVSGLKGPVRDVLVRSGLYQEIGSQHFFYTTNAAVARILEDSQEQRDTP